MASSRLLLTLVSNLLDIRKCDANMLDTFELTPQMLPANITESVNFCRPLAAITNVKLELKMEEVVEETTVQLNSLRFQHILVNLISKYNSEKGISYSVSYNMRGNNAISLTQFPFSR